MLVLPACCRGCELYEHSQRRCLLLARPSPENRRRLLEMPCDVQNLLARRFRAHGEDVARDALLTWLAPDWDAEEVLATLGSAPRDARLWLTAWPYLYLGRNAVRRRYRQMREQPVSEPPVVHSQRAFDPSLPAHVLRTLERLRAIDAVGYTMVVEMMRDELDVAAWRDQLGVSDATVSDRKYLALYRYSVLFFGVLDELDTTEGAALRARRFSVEPIADVAAVKLVRDELRLPDLSLSAFRDMARRGAEASLASLASPEALGDLMDTLATPFRRVLRLEGRAR